MPAADEPHVLGPTDPNVRLKAAFEANVPKVYFNGMMCFLGTGDVLVSLERNGEPVTLLNMSYTIAKTFALALGQIVANLEEQTGRDMLTATEVESKLTAKAAKESE